MQTNNLCVEMQSQTLCEELVLVFIVVFVSRTRGPDFKFLSQLTDYISSQGSPVVKL